jgi:hypothetical protein
VFGVLIAEFVIDWHPQPRPHGRSFFPFNHESSSVGTATCSARPNESPAGPIFRFAQFSAGLLQRIRHCGSPMQPLAL